MEPKEVQTSCEIETKLKSRISIDIQNIEQKYKIKENTPHLASKHYFTVNFKNGMLMRCYVTVTDQRNSKSIYLIICDNRLKTVKNLVSNHDLLINGTISRKNTKNGVTWKFGDSTYECYGIRVQPSFNGKFSSIKGFFEIECNPTPGVSSNLELTNLLHQDTFGSNTKELDFTILCKNKSFKFNKIKLCFMSDVFQKMIETTYSTESKTGIVEIQDFLPEVIEAFERVMFKNDGILDKEDLNVNLLMFANKYCIMSLVRVIANHLGNNINMENVYPVIQAAYLMDNDDLLKEASKFIGKNQGQFQNNEEWQQLRKSHPQLLIKLMDLVMFSK